jgi:UDP-N-acetylglucosamine 1-carboxyvinyltransferase
MQGLRIRGGRPLSGSVQVHGAKNSVLPILAATLLCADVCVLHNCPDLTDVAAAVDILRHLGCSVERQGDSITVDARSVTCCDVPDALMREMRSSIIFLGAVLSRCGRSELSFPGGCELGPRPIDLHLGALRSMGVEVDDGHGSILCQGRPRGTELTLSLPSVGATENVMLSACLAEGTTVLNNAAREPEIVDLQNFLRSMGADVHGAGSSTVVIEGGGCLHGAEYRVMSDRMVAATYASAVAATGGRVSLHGVERNVLRPVLEALSAAGCTVSGEGEDILLSSTGALEGLRRVRTAPYPGFPTDAQPMLMAALCRSRGTTVFVETMFENRYRQAPELLRMGADIRLEGSVAVVCGVPQLHAAHICAPDLRGAAALVVAALNAEGESLVTGLHHLDRGYARLEEDLGALGADIRRINVN